LRSSTAIAPKKVGSISRVRPAPGVRSLILPALCVLAALATLLALGDWQLRRLAWKEDLIARVVERPAGPVRDLPPAANWPALDIAEGEYRPYRLTGRFLHEKEALVFTSLPDPRGKFGGPGYWIVTPFALPGGGTVLINRGFAPQGRHLPADRGESFRSADATVTGLMRPGEGRHVFLPNDRPEENVFFARDIAAVAAAKQVPAPVAPFTIDLIAAETPAGGLPQAGETRMAFSNNHLQYAVTWYGLAAALLAVFVAFVAQRRRTGSDGRLTRRGEAP
jgi:surfeit locus 1 family protein